MKEAFTPGPKFTGESRNSGTSFRGEFDLTLKPNSGYSGERDIFFMPEPGGGENIIESKPVLMQDADGVTFSVSEGAPSAGLSSITSPTEMIQQPAIREYAEQFQVNMEPNLSELPADVLEDEYMKIAKMSHDQRLSGDKADSLQPYSARIIMELQNRGIDVAPLFTKSLELYAEPSVKFSAGADAEPTPDDEPKLPQRDNAVIQEAMGYMPNEAKIISDLWDEIEAGNLAPERRHQIEQELYKLAELLDKSHIVLPEGLDDSERFAIEGIPRRLRHEVVGIYNNLHPEKYRKTAEQKKATGEFETAVTAAYDRIKSLTSLNSDYRNRSAEEQAEIDEQYKIIEDRIHKLDFAGQSSPTDEIELIASLCLGEDHEGKEYYGHGIEYAVEQIIGRGDANPTSEYPQPGFYQGNNLDVILESARRGDEGFWIYLVNLRGKRILSHELFRNLKDRKTFVEYTTRALDTGGFRFIEDEVGGVSQVQSFYEQELAMRAGLKSFLGRGWLTFDDYFDPEMPQKDCADNRILSRVQGEDTVMQRGIRKWKRSELTKGWVAETVAQRKMRPWEEQRAFFMGRSLTAASQRRLIFQIFGDKPVSEEFIKSLEAEPMTSILSPVKFSWERWLGSGLSQAFLKHINGYKRERALEQDKLYGVTGIVNGKEKMLGLFGASVDSTVMIDTGVHDPKSSPWRQRLMFLRQPEYATVNGKTLGNYFHEVMASLGHHEEEGLTTFKDNGDRGNKRHDKYRKHHEASEETRKKFNKQVIEVVKKQRLFLGILLQNGDFTPGTKQEIWKNVSELMPSKIASLMPQFSMEAVYDVYGISRPSHDHHGEHGEHGHGVSHGQVAEHSDGENGHLEQDSNSHPQEAHEVWEGIMRKLFIIEQNRIQDDADGLKTYKDSGKPIKENYQVKGLDYYIDQYKAKGHELTDNELKVIHRWQQLGEEKSGQLARVITPVALFLDDVPRTAWGMMGRTDLDRILIGDQSGFEDAYGTIRAIAQNPAVKSEDVLKAQHHFVHVVSGILTLPEAQGFIEPHLATWLEMSKKYTKSKFMPFRKLMRKANCEIEEYNLAYDGAKDVDELAAILKSAAQQEIIADDPTETEKGRGLFGQKKKLTQYKRIAKKMDIDWDDVLRNYGRIFIMLFGPVLALEFMKSILPGDLAKSLG